MKFYINPNKVSLQLLKQKKQEWKKLKETNKNMKTKNIQNKTIYMTYKKDIPQFVYDRWLDINKDYKIDFSKDKDCTDFLKKYINESVENLFNQIEKGMHKADIWRLCKLYINSGVYADVDLVPYINIDKLDKDVTFYSCISPCNVRIFQAFIINNSKPKNPLILGCLLFLLQKKPFSNNGPTYNMYNFLKYNIKGKINSDTKYKLNTIKIPITIGSSNKNTKEIDLYYFPDDIQYYMKLQSNNTSDNFSFNIKNNKLIIKRLDNNSGWTYNHIVDICIDSNEIIYLFKENIGKNNNWVTSYVTYNNKKILDSRDIRYKNNNGW